MQKLKEEIRQSILNAALDEFYTQGFQNASIKKIAARAGISVGNLYHYFPNKESLLEVVVGPVVDTITHTINEQHLHAGEPQSELQQIINEQAVMIGSLIKENRKQLVILVFGSRGSRFENTREVVINYLEQHVRKELVQHRRPSNIPINEALARPLSISFLEGYFDIIRSNVDEEQILSLATDYMRMFLPVYEFLS